MHATRLVHLFVKPKDEAKERQASLTFTCCFSRNLMRLTILRMALRPPTTGGSGAKMRYKRKRLTAHHPPIMLQCPAANALVSVVPVVFIFSLKKKMETLKFYLFFYRPKINSLHLSNPPFITPVHSPRAPPPTPRCLPIWTVSVIYQI